VRHRHEHWDGSGHPDGQRGPAIPEGAQLLALAEAYDALTGDGLDGPRMSPAQALAELRRRTEGQFSAAVLELLASIAG
jgi:HD-GYP domain-containing protein (c-di-GMP phosphodiesterase class II)